MKVTFVFCVFPPETVPAAVMAGELVSEFVERGDDVTVVAPFPSRPSGQVYDGYHRSFVTKTLFRGAQLIRVPCFTVGARRRSISRVLENLSFGLASAVALMFLRRPDVVVVETWPVLANLFILAACRLRGIIAVNYIKDLYPEAMTSAG